MTCAAIIIDNRPGLEPVIADHKQFLPEDWPVYWIKDMATTNAMAYNRLLTSRRFWKSLPADKVLIFQHDSALLRHGIEAFLEWDFIGAPIKHIPGCMNGGLSLRDCKAMLKVINNIPWSPQLGNEDIYFVNALGQFRGHLPPDEVAKKFSCETEFQLGTLGYHAINRYLTNEQCNLIKNQYNGK